MHALHGVQEKQEKPFSSCNPIGLSLLVKSLLTFFEPAMEDRALTVDLASSGMVEDFLPFNFEVGVRLELVAFLTKITRRFN